MDEVCIWNKALNQDDIRDKMHLTKTPSIDYALIAYYQFNSNTPEVLDKVGVRHALFNNDAVRTLSSAPIGGGTSYRMNINSGGTKDFAGTGLTMTFPAGGTLPNGEVVVSRLNVPPDFLPDDDPISRSYWVINSYGSDSTFSAIEDIEFGGIGSVSWANQVQPEVYKLYKRNFNAHGDTWGSIIDSASFVSPGFDGQAAFSGQSITSFGQLVITNHGDTSSSISSVENKFVKEYKIKIFPNPASKAGLIQFATNIADEVQLSIFDATGKTVLRTSFSKYKDLPLVEYEPGVYLYQCRSSSYIQNGSFAIQ